jgi:hypothetical protein
MKNGKSQCMIYLYYRKFLDQSYMFMTLKPLRNNSTYSYFQIENYLNCVRKQVPN